MIYTFGPIHTIGRCIKNLPQQMYKSIPALSCTLFFRPRISIADMSEKDRSRMRVAYRH